MALLKLAVAAQRHQVRPRKTQVDHAVTAATATGTEIAHTKTNPVRVALAWVTRLDFAIHPQRRFSKTFGGLKRNSRTSHLQTLIKLLRARKHFGNTSHQVSTVPKFACKLTRARMSRLFQEAIGSDLENLYSPRSWQIQEVLQVIQSMITAHLTAS